MSIEKKSIEVGSFEWFYLQAKPEQPTDYPPILFLHGIPSLSHSWSAILPELASQGFWGIAPDWIGHGRSSKPDKRDFAYTPEAFIEALWLFICPGNRSILVGGAGIFRVGGVAICLYSFRSHRTAGDFKYSPIGEG